jgi:hypothetical protein
MSGGAGGPISSNSGWDSPELGPVVEVPVAGGVGGALGFVASPGLVPVAGVTWESVIVVDSEAGAAPGMESLLPLAEGAASEAL